MPNADMNRLIDNARIRLPGALDAALLMELFSTLDDFLTRSNLWYEDIDFAVVPASGTPLTNPDAFSYELLPTNGSPTRLLALNSAASGVFVQGYMPVQGTVILARSPQVAETYRARFALTVADPVTAGGYPILPDWIVGRYGNELLEGLLGRMMSQLAKPYSSTTMAMMHLKRFSRACSTAKTEAAHANVYGGQRWAFPQTFT